MHLYFIVRGVKHQVELFEKFMQTQMFPFKGTDIKTGKQVSSAVQGGLRPIQLYEYVFPESCLNEVFTMLDFKEDLDKTPYWGGGWAKYGVPILRKALGAEPMPKSYKKLPQKRFIFREAVGVEPIGIKKDKKPLIKDGIEYEEQL